MNNFKKNVSFNILLTTLSTISTFILMRVLFAYFDYDKEDYGLWLTIFSVLSYIYMMDFGISNGLRNIITPLVEVDKKKLEMYLSNSLIVSLIVTVIMLIVGNLIINLFPLEVMRNIKGFNLEIGYFRGFIQILFNLQILLFFISSFKPLFHAYSKSYIVSLIQLISNMFIIFILLVLIKMNILRDWYLIAYLYIGVQLMIYFSFILYFVSSNKINLKIKINKQMILELWNIGYKFFFLQLSNLILFNSLPLIVSLLVGLESSSKFQISYKLLSIYTVIFSMILSPIWTLLLIENKKRNFIKIKMIVKKLFILLSITAVLILMTSFIQNPLIFLWMGKNFYFDTSFNILISLLTILGILCSILQAILNGINKFKSQISGYLIGSLFLLIATFTFFDSNISLDIVLIFGIISLLIPVLFMLSDYIKYLRRNITNE